MPIFTDRAGQQHYITQPLDVIPQPGGLTCVLVMAVTPTGQLVGPEVPGSFETIVKAFRQERLAENGLTMMVDDKGIVQ